eukprot:404215-Prorocentrum_minimum.AAC.2
MLYLRHMSVSSPTCKKWGPEGFYLACTAVEELKEIVAAKLVAEGGARVEGWKGGGGCVRLRERRGAEAGKILQAGSTLKGLYIPMSLNGAHSPTIKILLTYTYTYAHYSPDSKSGIVAEKHMFQCQRLAQALSESLLAPFVIR